MSRPPALRWGSVLATAFVLFASCTSSEESLPSAAEAADEFVAAWSSGDWSTVAEMANLSQEADRLQKWFERQLERGEVTSFAVQRTGGVRQPDFDGPPPRTTATYDVTYVSVAARKPVVLAGTLDLSYDPGSDDWKVAWSKGSLWPGIDGATRFDVVMRWPPRAPILDRSGRRLAVGAEDRRRYPFGSLAGSAVGHLAPLERKELRDAHPLREAGDLVGASGIEEAFEERLAGEPATQVVVRDRRGRIVEELGHARARPGRPVRSTLDVEVQRAAESAYGATVGGAVVLEPSSGNLLAVVSSSSFDPNNYVGVVDVEPFNRALSGLYPPGSSLKAMTAAAALDAREVTPSTELTGPQEYKGVRNFESGEFGTIDFATALRHSVNTAFAQVAERLGARKLTRYAEGFGFNRAPRMPLEAADPSFPFPEDEGDLLWGAIGQAQVVASPLQMATIAATVANDGIRMEPRVARSEPTRGRRVIRRRTAETLTRLMEGVVLGGTGTAAQISGVRVAGKTGTAEVDVAGERRNHAWFICFAPAGAPDVAVALVSEYGGVGGRVAAPIARSILASVLPVLR
ncbi:MAG: peptidoglycan D,D-transpeptidase FtsI family protein [Actinomycetota bacterium]